MGAALSSPQTYDTQEALAAKLAAPGPCVVAFMSPVCGLCASLRPTLDQVSSSGSGTGSGSGSSSAGRTGSDGRTSSGGSSSLQVAVLDAQQDKLWAPEMLAYDVQAVPCFVLLDPGGRAVCKTAAPRSQQQMEAALAALVQHAGSMKGPRL